MGRAETKPPTTPVCAETGCAAAGVPASIHDIVKVKEPGLAARLVYDDYERRSALIRILLPAVRPGLITVGLFAFLTSWSEFFAPLILLNSSSLTPFGEERSKGLHAVRPLVKLMLPRKPRGRFRRRLVCIVAENLRRNSERAF